MERRIVMLLPHASRKGPDRQADDGRLCLTDLSRPLFLFCTATPRCGTPASLTPKDFTSTTHQTLGSTVVSPISSINASTCFFGTLPFPCNKRETTAGRYPAARTRSARPKSMGCRTANRATGAGFAENPVSDDCQGPDAEKEPSDGQAPSERYLFALLRRQSGMLPQKTWNFRRCARCLLS